MKPGSNGRESPFDIGPSLPTLQAQRVKIRWLKETDLPALFKIFSDSEVTKYWGSPALQQQEDAEKLLGEIRSLFQSRTLFQWGIARVEDDAVIGTCTLARLDANHRVAEIGFALARDCWGRGYMKEALPLMIDFAFSRLGLRRLEADADPRNIASLRLLDRFGFTQEGLLRERYCVNAELQDAVLLGLLRREWHPRSVPPSSE